MAKDDFTSDVGDGRGKFGEDRPMLRMADAIDEAMHKLIVDGILVENTGSGSGRTEYITNYVDCWGAEWTISILPRDGWYNAN